VSDNLDIGIPNARVLLFLSNIAYLRHPDKRRKKEDIKCCEIKRSS